MNKLNNHINRILINEYEGSEKKDTVILDDLQKYMIKKPDPTREIKRRDILPYQNNSFSEYIGCKISKELGFETQEVSLWEYDTLNRKGEEVTKIVCLCKDVRNKAYGEKLRDFEKVALGSDSVENNRKISFQDMEHLIDGIKNPTNMTEQQINDFKDFYYKVFILDTLIGNTDRHPGNIAIIVDNNDNYRRICPVYDCGSCLSPEIDDKEIGIISVEQIALSVDSAIYYENNGKKDKIRYIDYYEKRNEKTDKALTEIFPKINMNNINKIIDDTPFISDIRKIFYKESLLFRYEKVLIKGLLHIYPLNKEGIPEDINLYQLYLDNIKQINNLPLYEKSEIQIQDKSFDFMKVSNRFAICIEDGICKGIVPIRSNNDEIRQAINSLKTLGVDLTLDNDLEIESIER